MIFHSRFILLVHYTGGSWNALQTEGGHLFGKISGIPSHVNVGAFKAFSGHSGIPLRVGLSRKLYNSQPYPMPDCTPGGSTIPPVITHSGDTGPGRITEPGQQLHGGFGVYTNITIVGNKFEANPVEHFIDIGNTDGIVIENNSMSFASLLQGSPFVSDVHIYSSKGYDTAEIAKNNICVPSPCSVSVDNVTAGRRRQHVAP